MSGWHLMLVLLLLVSGMTDNGLLVLFKYE